MRNPKFVLNHKANSTYVQDKVLERKSLLVLVTFGICVLSFSTYKVSAASLNIRKVLLLEVPGTYSSSK